MKSITVLAYTAMFYVATLIGVDSFGIALKFWDPFYYRSVVAITPMITPMDCFIEELDVQRYRICKVDIDRFAIEEATGNVVFRERVPGGATSLGRNSARNMVCPSKPWPLGRIKLLQNTHSECIDGMHSMPWPVMRFEVVE